MLKKRFIAVVTIKNSHAVQSFGYNKYLPLGKPDVIVKNLDRWGVDEIILQCIDRTSSNLGPDFEVLNKISKIGISTPIIYGGGIRNADDAAKVVSNGADRILLDALLYYPKNEIEIIADKLGLQAIMANIPIRHDGQDYLALNYQTKIESQFNKIINTIPLHCVSEVLITDWCNEGKNESFNIKLLEISELIERPLIFFGGITSILTINKILNNIKTVGFGIGNFLNYQENAVQKLKLNVSNQIIRPPFFHNKEC